MDGYAAERHRQLCDTHFGKLSLTRCLRFASGSRFLFTVHCEILLLHDMGHRAQRLHVATPFDLHGVMGHNSTAGSNP